MMKIITNLKQTIRFFFGFRENEINGIIILFPLLMVLLVFLHYFGIFFHEYKNYPKEKEMLEEWASQIIISDDTLVKKNESLVKKYTPRKEKHTIQKKDINTATEIDFIPLRGIAEKLSMRIVKYRNALGGFYDYKQLYEVWGLDEKTIEEIKKYFFIAPEKCCKKININTLSADELKKHPYLRGNVFKIIVSYRAEHGKFNNASDLLRIKEIPDSLFAKIIPYIGF